jgi:hypothetical protein
LIYKIFNCPAGRISVRACRASGVFGRPFDVRDANRAGTALWLVLLSLPVSLVAMATMSTMTGLLLIFGQLGQLMIKS